MKKALYFAFTAFILTIMVFHVIPARAVELKFNGEYRIRAYAFDIDGRKDCDDSQTYYDQRFRLVFTAEVTENLKGVVRMVAPNNDKWGNMDTTGTIDSCNPWAGNVDFDLAYLDFAIPNTNLSAKVGKQYLKLGNYIVLGSHATYDAIMISTKIENVDLALFTAKIYEGNTDDSAGSSEDDEDLYGFTLGVNAAPNMNFGLFAVVGNDSSASEGHFSLGEYSSYSDIDGLWLGLTAEVDYAPVKLNFELDYSSVKFNRNPAENGQIQEYKSEGYAVFADACVELEFAKVGIAALMTTGNKEDDSAENDYSVFTPISSRFSYYKNWDLMVIEKLLERSKGDNCINNLTTLKVYAMKDLTPKTTAILSVQTYNYTENIRKKNSEGEYEYINYLGEYEQRLFNKSTSDEINNLGVEIDAILKHKLYENLTVTAAAGYWLTDKETFGEDSDDNWLLKACLLLEF